MKVFSFDRGDTRLIGRCDVADDGSLLHEVPLVGSASTIMERYAIGEVCTYPPDGGVTVERGIILIPGQHPELLPGWQPLTS